MKATDLLKKDHAEVKKLFTEFNRAGQRAGRKRQQLVERIGEELEVHARIEEEIFYPAVRQVEEGRELVQEARHEHDEVKKMLAEIRRMEPDSEELAGRVKELKQAVEHHVKEEEGEMFRQARQLGAEELLRLGEQLRQRKTELMGGARQRGRRPAARRSTRKAA